MSNVNNQVIRNMQADDRRYGEGNEKRIVQKDKSQKHRQNFTRMSMQDIKGMQEDDDYEYEEGYETN